MGGAERVTVAHWGAVLGLERKVLVWLPGRALGDNGTRGRGVEATGRLLAVSAVKGDGTGQAASRVCREG